MAKKKKVADISAELKLVKDQIKMNSKDVHFADKLITDLLSLQKQKDQQPMYLCVPESEVVKTYDFGSFSISNCKGGILFHTKGGYNVYTTPRVKVLYEHLELLLSMKENYDTLTEDGRKSYDNLFLMLNAILMAPIMAPITAQGLIDTANAIVEIFDREAKTLANQPLLDDDALANAEFDNMISATEELKKMGKDE